MRLEDAAQPSFARHETFHPRWGWIMKSYRAAATDARVFNNDDATVRLGVGKNMVRAIKFWGVASKVITSATDPNRSRVPLYQPTRIGTALFAEHGFDPYCEHPGTLWVTHWLMLARPCVLPVWWAAFNEFTAVEFSDEQLDAFALDRLDAVSVWKSPLANSVRKDVSCLLRSYAPSAAGGRQGIDDLVDSPLRELGLLRCTDPRQRVYRFVGGPKPTLPPEIAAYAALDYLDRSDERAHTATLSRLAGEPGGPGRVFRLT